MKKNAIKFSLLIFIFVLMFSVSALAQASSTATTSTSTIATTANTNISMNCNIYWYFDNLNSICQQKQFCGAFLYQGLRTFSSQTSCQSALSGNMVATPTTSSTKTNGLTQGQINAIITMIKSFGVDATTIANVQAALNGQPTSAVSVAPSNSICENLTSNLKYGETNNNVSALQDFLYKNSFLQVNPTGYFGTLTLAAIKAFQSVNGINGTGEIDSQTWSKIQSFVCVNTSVPATSASSTPPITGKADSFAPKITLSASPAQVIIGQPTTLTWNASNATGTCDIAAKDSSGKTLHSTIDNSGIKSTGEINSATTYTIICYNKYGIPGTQSVVIKTVSTSSLQTTYAQAPEIISVNPTSGNRGDTITIIGSSFLSTNNIIFDGTKVADNLILSKSSTSISFKIPAYNSCLSASCLPPKIDTTVETGGQKIIQVSNTNGYSNDFTFTLPSKIITIPGATAVIPYTPPKLSINSINPTSGNRGDVVTLYGSGFSSDSLVLFGGFEIAKNLIVSQSGNSISFIVPSFQMGCTDPIYETCPRLPVAGSGTIIETGSVKNVYVINTSINATSTTVKFTLPSKKITY